MRWLGAVPAALLVLVGAFMAQLAVAAGCSENLHEGTSRKTACDAVGTGPVWWVPIVVPSVAVFLVVALGRARIKWAGMGVVIGIAAIAEAVLLAVVSSNLWA